MNSDEMSRGLVGIPWLVCATSAFVVAVVFVFVVPRSAGATGLEYVVLRWFHSLVWVLLGLAALARQFLPTNERLAGALAQLALVVYVVYFITFVRAA